MRDLQHYDRAIELMKGAMTRYLDDLAALTEEQLAFRQGKSRSAYDFTYEVALVNRAMARRIAGEEAALEFDGWVVAPPEMCAKEPCARELRESCEAVIAAVEARGRDGALAELTTPRGPSSPYEVASFLALHTMYHDAQLNYIQSLQGDDEMHWSV